MRYRQVIGFMVLVLLAAAVLRLPDLPATPPGLHYDEAANGVLAADIGLRGERPIFIPSYTGKEVLFFYLAGGLMRLLGDTVFALRLTAAFIGLLTVAVTYWLGWELLRDRRTALLAAALIAVSFWHLLFSRLGFRAISQPLLQGLMIAALFRGLRLGSWRWFAFSGLCLGLSAYTYLAVRFFPIPLLLALLPILFNRRELSAGRPLRLALLLAIGLAVLAPLLLYFANNPDAFLVRARQVLPGGNPLELFIDSFEKTLAMFFLIGDPYWRFNIPDRPLFDWFWGGLLLVAWGNTLWHWRAKPPIERAANWLLVGLSLIMLLPSALAIGEIVPSNLRVIGLLPFVYLLAAKGFLLLITSLLDQYRAAARLPQLRKVHESSLVLLTVGLVLAVGGFATGRTYFQEWANRADVFYDSDADLAAIASYLDQIDTTDRTIYVAALHYRHPTLAFLSQKYDAVKWLPQSQALVFPENGRAIYIFPHNSPPPTWGESFLAGMSLTAGPLGPDGHHLFVAYESNQPVTISIPNPINARFGNQMTLLGYEMGSGASGETLPLNLYWQAAQTPTAAFMPFIHFEDRWRHRWSQLETSAYPAEQWTPDEIIIQRVEIPLPPGLPPDTYRIRVGLFNPADQSSLALVDNEGRYAGSAYIIEQARVTAGSLPETLPIPPHPVDETTVTGLTLLGYERGPAAVPTGAAVDFALWWQAERPLNGTTTRVELLRPDNTGVILANLQPVYNSFPFAAWPAPIFLIDRQSVTIPQNFTPGEYLVSIRLLGSNNETLLTADIGQLTVEESIRLFTPPKPTYPLPATFNDEIKLLGYDLEPLGNNQFSLALIWQALDEPAGDYTVFVHALDLDGVCCPWQSDQMPQQGTYPTSQWLTDEVVVDRYTITLPEDTAPGQYPLEIGLFIPENGRRLVVTIPGLPANDAVFLRPLEIEP
jgi:4-amino-4-deoxy-L-arabinose transferase-like glycosyltransferase